VTGRRPPGTAQIAALFVILANAMSFRIREVLFAGATMLRSDRADVNATFLQPFLTFTTPTKWMFGLNTESTYDWQDEQWSVPVNISASKLTRLGTQLVSLGGGVRYWPDSPDSGAEGLGLRLTVTLLFPR
jgi:hypothetical protein